MELDVTYAPRPLRTAADLPHPTGTTPMSTAPAPWPEDRESRADVDAGLEANVITFEEGIPGFPQAQHFLLVNEVDDAAFQLLQCVDAGIDTAFIVAVPWLFFPTYAPEISEHEAAELGITDPAAAIVFCPVTLHPEEDRITLNLLGPFIVNAETRRGRQLVLTDQDLDVQAEIDLGDL